MPDSYLYLGLLAALFPQAKCIHCRRELRNISVSCWMTNFRHIRWANDPGHTAGRFEEYRCLMDTRGSHGAVAPASRDGDGSQTTVGSGLWEPEGVAVDGQGDAFIADTFNNRVVEVAAGLPLPSARRRPRWVSTP
jgi:hypothetical protein